MHDAVQFEKAGIPAAVFVEDLFKTAAATKARLMGIPEYRPVIVSHPIGDREEATRKGKAAADEVVRWLTRGDRLGSLSASEGEGAKEQERRASG